MTAGRSWGAELKRADVTSNRARLGFWSARRARSTGAVLGPLFVGAALYLKDGYQGAFAILAIPAVLAMMVLFAARHFYPRPRDLDVAPRNLTAGHLPRRFWV